MGKDNSLRYRAICYKCEKPFDSRQGVPFLWGNLCCPDCYKTFAKYATLEDYLKNEHK